MSEDWIEEDNLPAIPDPKGPIDRVIQLAKHWAKLTPKQKNYLTVLRDCGMNARKAGRQIDGHGHHTSRMSHKRWLDDDKHYAAAFTILQRGTAADALDKERLLTRQDYIVEELLVPRPVLFQGQPTGVEEADLSAASRANEVLLDRAMPKPRADVEVNVGVAFTPVQVEVEDAGSTLEGEVQFVEASPQLPDDDWLAS